MHAVKSIRNWMMLVWALWMASLFGNYFYHMLTLPDRWGKIVDMLQRLLP